MTEQTLTCSTWAAGDTETKAVDWSVLADVHGRYALSKAVPLVLVAVILLWKSPTASAASKIASSLYNYDTVGRKPVNRTLASVEAFVGRVSKLEIPEGLVSLITGPCRKVDHRHAESTVVNAISFTGSVPVGNGIAAAATRKLTKVAVEIGARHALADTDVASSRIVTQDDNHDASVEKRATSATRKWVGLASAEGTDQRRKNPRFVDRGQSAGAGLACSGMCLDRRDDGSEKSPGVFTNTMHAMRINHEETVAALTGVFPTRFCDDALATVKDTSASLASGVVTRDLTGACHVRRDAKACVVTVNVAAANTDDHVPFARPGDRAFVLHKQGKAAAKFCTYKTTHYISAGGPG